MEYQELKDCTLDEIREVYDGIAEKLHGLRMVRAIAIAVAANTPELFALLDAKIDALDDELEAVAACVAGKVGESR